MKRFILVSFAFMGWAFYEMSGGSDFDASAVREARLAALEAEQKARAPAAPVVVADAPEVVVSPEPTSDTEVTRVSLNLTTLQPTPATEPEAGPAIDADAVTTALTEAIENTDPPLTEGSVTASVDTPAIIPSLINPNDGLSTPISQIAASFDDIRTVSGNRVNVRSGPGTDFGVVARVVRGDEVKVLEDNGNGWVRFETVDGTTGGWMADFLLADS